VEEPKPLKKQAQIKHDEAFARELEAELNKTINWDDVIDQVQRKEKEDNVVMSVVVDDVLAAVEEPSIPSPTPTTQPPPPSQDLPSTSQDAEISMDLLHTLLETCTTLTRRVKHLEQDKITQTLKITMLKQRVKMLERRNKLKVSKLRKLKRVETAQRVDTSDDTVMEDVSKQGRIIANMDADMDVTLKDVADIAKEVDVDAKIEEITAASATITAVATLISTAVITTAPSAARKRKGVVIRDPEETATPSSIIHSKPKSKDKGKGIMVEEPKPLKKQVPNDDDDVYTEATPLAHKVPIVDYGIYTENNKPYYKIIRADGSLQLFLSFLSLFRNFDREDLEVLWELVKERFSYLKPKNFSDDFLLTTLTYMFEKPDVQAQVWKNQRTVHGLAKVKSWRLLESCGVHIITFTTTQMILLVEKRYLLTRFNLVQMLNNVRVEVVEESKVSLELLRFVRQQQQEGF
nr:hypothetical protein [Tanacetum cinerariifolium]